VRSIDCIRPACGMATAKAWPQFEWQARNRVSRKGVMAIMPSIMRKWLASLLVVFMSAQFAWAAVSPYCAHDEKGKAALHFGHHEHEHGPSAANSSSEPESQDSTEPAHGHHHHGGGLGVITSLPLPFVDAPRTLLLGGNAAILTDAPAARIERPKWPRLA